MNPYGFSSSRMHWGRRFSQHQIVIICIGIMLISLVFTSKPVLANKDSEAKIAVILANLQLLKQETTSASVLIDDRRFNYDAIIREVGNNPKDLYQWVKTNTKPLPYRGILKGAWGVLMERQGNSIDRSLLLAELLDRTGHRVELVHSTLNNRALSIAKDLVLHELGEPPVVGAKSDSTWTKEDLVEHQATLAELAGTSSEVALKEAAQKEIKTFAEITRLIAEANKQTEALMRKLPMDDHSPLPLLNEALASLEDHWWVELTTGAKIEVFDFFFERESSTLEELGYTTGDRMVFAQENLPENLYHHITFRIIADQNITRGEKQTRTAFSHTVRTAESRLKLIQLSFFAMKHNVEATEKLLSSPDASRKDLAKQDEWLPTLKIGQKTFAEAVIRADGTLDLEPKLQNGPLQGMQGRSYTPVQDSQLTAVRLEIDIVGGGIKNTESRILFDYRDHLAVANASQEKRNKENSASAAAVSKAQAEAIVSKENQLRAEFVAKERACSEESGVAIENLGVLSSGSEMTFDEVQMYGELMASETCLALAMDRAYQSRAPAKKSSQPPTYRISRNLKTNTHTGNSVFREEMNVARAASFMTIQQFLILPFSVPDAYIAEQLRGTALYYQKVLVKLLNGTPPFTTQKFIKELESYDASALKLLSFATLRQQPDTGGAFAITHANLVSKLGMVSFEQSNVELTNGIDIVANTILPLSRDAERGRQTAIRQGVLDTLIENHLVAGGQDSTNTASQFHSDLEKNEAMDWVAAKINIEPKVFSRLNLKDDPETLPLLVYSPLRLAAEPASTSFWLINMKTGQTLGYLNNGRGGVIEFILGMNAALNQGKAMQTMMGFGKCFAQAAIESCRMMGCIAKGMGHYLSSGVEGVFGAALPGSSVKDYLGALSKNRQGVENFLLKQAVLKTIDVNFTSKVLAQIVATTDELAETTNRIMCSLDQAEPSIISKRSTTN